MLNLAFLQNSSAWDEILSYKAMGLELWQVFALIGIVIAALIMFFIFKAIFRMVLLRIVRRTPFADTAEKYLIRLYKPLSWLLIIIIASIFQQSLKLPEQLDGIITYLFKAAMPFLTTLIIYRLVDLFAEILDKLASKTKTTVDDHMVPLARKAMKVMVVVAGGIFILENVDIQVTPLLAGISIGGLAFALAAQDTIKNFFGSITIFTDQPFEVGDWIVFDGNEGTVEEVGVRSTRVRTFYNSLVSIPNGKLADVTIDNMGRRQYRRYFTKLTVTYDTPPELLDAFVKGLRAIVDHHPQTRKDYYQIHLNNFGSSAIEVMFYIFFEVEDWTQELEARHEIINEVIRLSDSIGVRFAFNTQTIHVEDLPGQKTLTPNSDETIQKLDQNMNLYMEKMKNNMQSLEK